MKKNESGESVLEGSAESEILEKLAARVEKAVAVITELRRERDGLRARVDELEGEMQTRRQDSERLGSVEEENERYKTERNEIRTRIETVLDRLEALEEGGTEL